MSVRSNWSKGKRTQLKRGDSNRKNEIKELGTLCGIFLFHCAVSSKHWGALCSLCTFILSYNCMILVSMCKRFCPIRTC